MMRALLLGEMLLLLTLANGTPVVAKRLLGVHFAWPIDCGRRFIDGRPLLGPSKTWRGVGLAVAVTAVGSALLGLGAATGALVGGAAMVGDLCSSFVKRRLDLHPSSRATGLDQIPEALFPLLVCRQALELGWPEILLALAFFFVGEIVFSRVLFALGIRDRPY